MSASNVFSSETTSPALLIVCRHQPSLGRQKSSTCHISLMPLSEIIGIRSDEFDEDIFLRTNKHTQWLIYIMGNIESTRMQQSSLSIRTIMNSIMFVAIPSEAFLLLPISLCITDKVPASMCVLYRVYWCTGIHVVGQAWQERGALAWYKRTVLDLETV